MGGWSQSSLEPVACVFKLQPINRGTWLRGRPQSVAELSSSSAAHCLLLKREQVSGPQIICIWIQDQRIGEAAVEL